MAGRGFDFNEDTPVIAAFCGLAIIGEVVIKRYAPPSWKRKWLPEAVTWGPAVALSLAYIYWLKPLLPWDAIWTWYYFR